MSSIEAVLALATERSATAAAHMLFDEVIVPAAAEGRAGYFPPGFEPERTTYFVKPSIQTPSAHFDFPGNGDADGLIEALIEHWAVRGEHRLAASGPRLKEIIAALRAEAAESNGDVDPYCYTMF